MPKKLNVWTCCTNGSELAGRRVMPTVGLGPCNIRDARIIDESIELLQLYKVVEVYKNLVTEIVQ